MSSTTERTADRGQILVLFAGAAIVLFLVAALAFDVGVMLLERRDQQDAADAASLAGARYVLVAAHGATDCATMTGPAPLEDSPTAAAWAACNVARANQSGDDETVTVRIPPIHGDRRYRTDGFIEVQIESNRPSVFGGIIGRAAWPVGVMAVAANQQGILYSFGMLALNETKCKAIAISGTGTVVSAANVQSNSTGTEPGCDNIGLARTGGGVLNVTADDAVCRSGGVIQDQGVGSMTCTKDEYSFALPDPLRNLLAPGMPGLAAPMQEVLADGSVVDPDPSTIPDGCPGAAGGKAPSEANPQTCVLGQGAAQADRTWILSDGLYPGGINAKGGVTLYLLPGIYWIGGGGFQGSGDASIISVESPRREPIDLNPAVCPSRGRRYAALHGRGRRPDLQLEAAQQAAGPITLGGGGATLQLQPYHYPFGDTTIDLVIFEDRTVNIPGDDVTLNGSGAEASAVRGIVYVPIWPGEGQRIDSVFTIDQVIADTFKINGSGGTIKVLRETGVDAEISAVGLVE